jgi:hypothetical protein
VSAGQPVPDPVQAVRTLRALELIAESHEAFEAGDVEGAMRILDGADAPTVDVIFAAMEIGQIPDPHHPLFGEMLAGVRDAVTAP